MKKRMRRVLGAALSLVMAVGLLSGCSSSYDPVKEVMGYSRSTVMFTVNGNDVTAGQFFFWMSQNADTVASYSQMSGATEIDWTTPMGDDMTMDDYVKEQSKAAAVFYNVIETNAKDKGYTMTEEDKADYEEQVAQAQEQMGGAEAYELFLKENCLTEEDMEELSSVGVLYGHMLEGMFREGGEYAPTEEELDQYIQDEDLMYAKHILFMTMDPTTGAALTEEEAAEKKAAAEADLAALQAITDPVELAETFDALMNEHSEDSGLADNPDGYLFTSGDMVEEFENATKELEPGQISGIVETTYGYHIILRLDPKNAPTLNSQWGEDQMGALVDQWVEEAEVVTTEEYDALTTADFYEKLTAYRETLEPAEEDTTDATTEEPTGEDVTTGEDAATGEDTTTGEDAATGQDQSTSAEEGAETGDGETTE
ncbi:MAG: peptidylprolyl isomerase [Evtepia sp.]